MKTRFNWAASTRESELVLAGECKEEDLDQLSRLFLDNLCRVTELDSQLALLKVSDLPGKYKVLREGTSTSSSGRHLRHFKLLFKNIDERLKDKERKQLEDIQKTIST